MQKFWVTLAASLFLAATPANATNLPVKFTNISGDMINQITATPKDAPGVSTQILSNPIANGGNGEATLEAPGENCVFTLNFTFASGKTLERSDTDLCQTDTIVVE